MIEAIDKKLLIGSDIALYLADVDNENKEKYICRAFEFKPDVLNLLRIINNGYYKNYEENIKNKIANSSYDEEDGIMTIENYYYLQFFCGNFEEFYNESIKHKELLGWSCSFEKTAVYLWLLLLNDVEIKAKSYSKFLQSVFEDIGYCDKESVFLGEDIHQFGMNGKAILK